VAVIHAALHVSRLVSRSVRIPILGNIRLRFLPMIGSCGGLFEWFRFRALESARSAHKMDDRARRLFNLIALESPFVAQKTCGIPEIYA
jgi:hypothetical protein